MNKEQAHIFFPHSSEDDLDDLWEQRLFEQKQFFLTRPPIRKVWEGRLNRLAQQHQAYLTLTEQTMVDESPWISPKNNMSSLMISLLLFTLFTPCVISINQRSYKHKTCMI